MGSDSLCEGCLCEAACVRLLVPEHGGDGLVQQAVACSTHKAIASSSQVGHHLEDEME